MGDLSSSVIRTDARLERDNERSTEQLAEHRWRWTLDETNPRRVSIRTYAKEVGRSPSSVRAMVNGYVKWCDAPEGTKRTLGEFIDRAKVGEEKAAAIDAVATATGGSYSTAAKRHNDVQAVRSIASSRAERRGTTAREEMAGAAKDLQRSRESKQKAKAGQKARHTTQYLRVEGELSNAMRHLRPVFEMTEGVEFSAEERKLIRDTLDNIKALLGLIDARVTGRVDVDWDSEMKKLVS